MTLYSSREPFNDDPEPYVTYADDRRTDVRSKDWDMQSDGAVEYVRVHDPRPEYDRPQNNPTNPILTDIRKNRPEGLSWAKMLKHYNWVTFAAAHYITEDWERITDEDQIDHTRKVLTRLATLEKEES